MNSPQAICDCCRRPLMWEGRSYQGTLKGLCVSCCKGLGGGVHSARIIKAEAKAVLERRR